MQRFVSTCKVSIVACAIASALFSPAKSPNAPASELNASNSASLRSLAKSISSWSASFVHVLDL